jgi:hypothetical protein
MMIRMRGRVLFVVFLVMLVVVPTLSLGTLQHERDTHRLDPGWIRGPIWGFIDGYEFSGPDNESLLFLAKNVRYFGIGHAFNAGLYPRHWKNIEVDARYSFFEGIITDHFIFGKISGLPNQ